MSLNGYYNGPAAEWARQNIKGRVDVIPLFSSRLGKIFTYALLFSVPGAFFVLGVIAFALGLGDRYVYGGTFGIGSLMLIPCGIIALLGIYVRVGFVRSLDADSVNGTRGKKFSWAKLYYVNHVTKHFRVGRVSRRIKDNQLELAFEGGKLIIPPLIREREMIWALINSMPAEVRHDNVPGHDKRDHHPVPTTRPRTK